LRLTAKIFIKYFQHEGSSPPQDLTLSPKASSSNGRNILVLDIAGPAVQPNSYVPLMLRRPDERRKFTQTWKFTDDGRLVCTHRGLYAQAKDGFLGLVKGKFDFNIK
jgi:vacuolar protein sorting-associated protein 13D